MISSQRESRGDATFVACEEGGNLLRRSELFLESKKYKPATDRDADSQFERDQD